MVPAECGVTDEPGQWRLKTKCLLRSMCLWLNKGVDTMHYFCAWRRRSRHGPAAAGSAQAAGRREVRRRGHRADEGPPQPDQGLRRCQPAKTTDLKVEVARAGADRKIFDGDATHPSLWNRNVFAFLPFQVDDGHFVVAVYVMTYDAAVAMPPQEYTLTVRALPAGAKFSLYDPVLDQELPIVAGPFNTEAGAYTVKVSVVDYPHLLKITR